MLQDSVIIISALVYVGVLFGVAYYGDKRADAGRSIIANPYIYTLSIAVYCTAWTFLRQRRSCGFQRGSVFCRYTWDLP